MTVDDDGVDPGTTDGGIADLWDSVRVDDRGRRWTVADIDLAGLYSVITAYDAEVGEEDQATEDPATAEAVEGTLTQQSWTEGCVVFPFEADQVFWDTDDRSPFFTPPSVRQDKVVMLGPDDQESTATYSSGVLVQPDRVLTAAHPLIAPGGAKVGRDEIVVCTRGNAQTGAVCSRVEAITIHRRTEDTASALAPTDPLPLDFTRRDLAMLELVDPLPGGNMLLSRASGSTIAAEPVWRHGRSLLRTRVDGGQGMSGGPVYYYPEGCCGRHLLTAIHASWVKAAGGLDDTAFHAETRIKPARSWAIGLMGLEP